MILVDLRFISSKITEHFARFDL